MERSPQRRLHLPIHANYIPDAGRIRHTKHSLCSIQSNPQCNSESSAPEISWNDIWQYFHVSMEAQVENHRDNSTAIQVGIGEDDNSNFVSIWECNVVKKQCGFSRE